MPGWRGGGPGWVVQVPWLPPPFSSYWVNLVTPVPFGLAKQLVRSLSVEVVAAPGGEDIRRVVPDELLSYDEAVTLALRRVRDREVATSWREAARAARSPAEPYPGDPDWSGGTLLSDVRTVTAHATAGELFTTVSAVGGEGGWPAHGWAWRVRGLFDQIIGGVGLRRGRRDPHRLRVGDTLDFWRVEDLREPRNGQPGALRLQAEMRLPGRAWLEWRITPHDGRVELRQRALFAPRGLVGRLYWWALVPFHRMIFSGMATELARRAEEAAVRARAQPPTPS
jgi:hypothetical protein